MSACPSDEERTARHFGGVERRVPAAPHAECGGRPEGREDARPREAGGRGGASGAARPPPRRRRGGRKQRGETGGLEFRALLRPTEILFGASNFAHAVHLEGSRRPRVLPAAVFPEVGLDCLSALIHARDVQPSDEKAAACQRWIDGAQFERLLAHQQAAIQLSVGPVRVRQKAGGGVEVFATGGRHLRFAPEQVEVSVRVRGVEASCRKHGVGHFKCGRRRLHTSRSGIVVSDAKTATSIDNFGVLHSH
ncbi:hypothetical protein M3Y99_01102300 [Aphelenchoides fujianensis]|nr:hypothetical protein M3Y99_01102300 [Aphelenchoides fujianensis]